MSVKLLCCYLCIYLLDTMLHFAKDILLFFYISIFEIVDYSRFLFYIWLYQPTYIFITKYINVYEEKYMNK